MAEAYVNGYQDVGTSSTAIYTTPAGTEAIVRSLYIANVDGSNSADITVEIVDDGGSPDAKIASAITVPAKSTFQAIDVPIFLNAGDAVKLLASATGDLEAVISVVQIT